MTKDNAVKRLLDSEQELSYSQRIAIANLLKAVKEETKSVKVFVESLERCKR